MGKAAGKQAILAFNESRQGKKRVEGIDLGSLLQSLNLEGATCRLTVCHVDWAGELYLEEGAIVHAVRAAYSGAGVAAWIISDHFASGGDIWHELGREALTENRTVNDDLYHILLKAADAVRAMAA